MARSTTTAKPAGKALALVAIAAGLSTAAAAQPAAGPADAKASVPPTAYESPFAGYRSHADAKVGPWRGVNEEVGRIGGWKAYAREAYEASQAAQSGGKPQPVAPLPSGHPGAKPPQ